MSSEDCSRYTLIYYVVIAIGLSAASWNVPAISAESNLESRVSSRAPTMKMHQTLNLNTRGATVAIAWSADGSMLAAASNYGSDLYIWRSDGHILQQIQRAGDGPAVGGSIAFTPHDQGIIFSPRVSDGSDAAATIWDVRTGNVSGVIAGPQPGDDYPLNRLQHFALTPNQATLVAVTGGQSAVKGLSSI